MYIPGKLPLYALIFYVANHCCFYGFSQNIPITNKKEEVVAIENHKSPVEKQRKNNNTVNNKQKNFYHKNVFFGSKINLYYMPKRLITPGFFKDIKGNLCLEHRFTMYQIEDDDHAGSTLLKRWGTDLTFDYPVMKNLAINSTASTANTKYIGINKDGESIVNDVANDDSLYVNFSPIFLLPSILIRTFVVDQEKAKQFKVNFLWENELGIFNGIGLSSKIIMALINKKFILEFGAGFGLMNNCYLVQDSHKIKKITGQNINSNISNNYVFYPMHTGCFNKSLVYHGILLLRIILPNHLSMLLNYGIKKKVGFEIAINLSNEKKENFAVNASLCLL
jgi:hypothetical protein